MMSGTGRRKIASSSSSSSSSLYIPTELCGEILYRLPSNDLLNFKLVCRDWRRLISSKGFIQKHLERSKADCDNIRVVIKSSPSSSTHITGCANNATKQIVLACEPYLLGSCDGLVLYYDRRRHKIAAFNPSLHKLLQLTPHPSIKDYFTDNITERRRLIFSWFGSMCSMSTEEEYEYVLVLAHWLTEKNKSIILVKVFSLSRDNNIIISSSRELDTNSSVVCRDERIGTVLHGRLHCSATIRNGYGYGYEEVILVYDFETNEITTMSPPLAHFPTNVLGVVEGCLCAMRKEQVWMMEEYGVEASWTEYARIEGYEINGVMFTALAFCPNGRDAIVCDRLLDLKVSKYRLMRERERLERETKASSYVFYSLQSCTVIACIDSLVSPTLLWREDE